MSKLPSLDLGTFKTGPQDGKPFKVELELLMEQNLLIQANSGGGKSWALRRLIERAYGHLPIIVIDPEGEFSTLRANYDFLLVGKDGETPADVRSAKLLAHRLLELRVSAVCNLFDLPPPTRVAWVAAFIQAIVDSPKSLWGDVAIAIDEAHDFAPEKGHGRVSDAASAATMALASLASKGRKRGQLTIAATQRLGKFSKDVAAELKTVLIGQTFIDIDRERAAEALGIAKAAKKAFFDSIKEMPPGDFYALGRAMTKEPTRMHVGAVTTEHPTRGHRQAATPPPTAKILHLLPRLSDLPKEAETQLRNESELRAEVKRLRLALKTTELPVVPLAKPKTVVVTKPLSPKIWETLAHLSAEVGNSRDVLGSCLDHAESVVSDLKRVSAEIASVHRGLVKVAPLVRSQAGMSLVPEMLKNGVSPKASVRSKAEIAVSAEGISLSKAAKALLTALAQLDGVGSDDQISVLSGYSTSSSSFANARSELTTQGLVIGPPEARQLTDLGRSMTKNVIPAPRGQELLDWWLSNGKLGKCEGVLLSTLFEHDNLTPTELSEKTTEPHYSETSSSFNNGLSTLRRARLISGGKKTKLQISELFRE